MPSSRTVLQKRAGMKKRAHGMNGWTVCDAMDRLSKRGCTILFAAICVGGLSCQKDAGSETLRPAESGKNAAANSKAITIGFDNSSDTIRIGDNKLTSRELSQKIENWCPFDLAVGPKGDVFDFFDSVIARRSLPAAAIPWLYYDQLRNIRSVQAAIPIVMADVTHKGRFPVVGTTKDYFTTSIPGRKNPQVRLQSGQALFAKPADAIIGAEVARKNGWKHGAKIRLIAAGVEDHVHEKTFTVTGVLAEESTPNDRTVFISLDGFYKIKEHGFPENEMKSRLEQFFGRKYTPGEWDALRKKQHATRLISAVFVIARRPPEDKDVADTPLAFKLEQEINRGGPVMAVQPSRLAKTLIRKFKRLATFLQNPDLNVERK